MQSWKECVTMGSKPYDYNQQSLLFFIRPAASNQDFATCKSRYENQETLKFRQLNVNWTQHAKTKSQCGADPDINTAAYMINYQGMCTKANFQWQMTYNLNKNVL